MQIDKSITLTCWVDRTAAALGRLSSVTYFEVLVVENEQSQHTYSIKDVHEVDHDEKGEYVFVMVDTEPLLVFAKSCQIARRKEE